MSPPFPDFTGIILDGGRATRLAGAHKAFLPVGGRPLVLPTVELFRELFADVLACSERTAAWSSLGIRCASDPLPGCGPLGGLAGGLAACTTRFAFVAAGDMPSISRSVVIALCQAARASGRTTVPRRGGRPEPLHAVHAAADAPAALEALKDGIRKLTDYLARLDVEWVDVEGPSGLGRLEGAAETFRNVNRPDDL